MTFTLSRHRFSGPHAVRGAVPCRGPGLYAFLDGREVLYIGQSAAVRYRVGPGHHKWSAFARRAAQPRIGYLCMADQSAAARTGLEKVLIRIHRPALNG